MNSPEGPLFHKGDVLYGLHLARTEIARRDLALVVEGYTDVLALAPGGPSERRRVAGHRADRAPAPPAARAQQERRAAVRRRHGGRRGGAARGPSSPSARDSRCASRCCPPVSTRPMRRSSSPTRSRQRSRVRRACSPTACATSSTRPISTTAAGRDAAFDALREMLAEAPAVDRARRARPAGRGTAAAAVRPDGRARAAPRPASSRARCSCPSAVADSIRSSLDERRLLALAIVDGRRARRGRASRGRGVRARRARRGGSRAARSRARGRLQTPPTPQRSTDLEPELTARAAREARDALGDRGRRASRGGSRGRGAGWNRSSGSSQLDDITREEQQELQRLQALARTALPNFMMVYHRSRPTSARRAGGRRRLRGRRRARQAWLPCSRVDEDEELVEPDEVDPRFSWRARRSTSTCATARPTPCASTCARSVASRC